MAAIGNGTIITPPDPESPMAFVPSVQTYATVGALAVLLWDILLHIPQDYKLATKHRINLHFVIYWIARLASLLYVLGVVIISTAEVEQCKYFRLTAIMYPFAMPLTILPFVVRIFALYHYNKYVIAFFSITWLSVLGSCVVMPIGIISITTGTRKYCLQSKLLSMPAMRIFLFVHDSFIFLATSWALMRNSYQNNAGLGVKKSIKDMVLSSHLFPFSMAILREGQAYFLTVLIFKLIFLILPYSLPQVRTQCTLAVVLISNMSSYVYRSIRLGFYQDYTISTAAINKAINVPTTTSARVPAVVRQDGERMPRNTRVLPSVQHHELMFRHPSPFTECSEGGDLEAGDIRRADEEVEGPEVQYPRNAQGVQTEM